MQRDDELWELLISLALGSAELTGARRGVAQPLPQLGLRGPCSLGLKPSPAQGHAAAGGWPGSADATHSWTRSAGRVRIGR